MSRLDIFDRQRDFGEESCWCLQIGIVVVAGQQFHSFVVVGDEIGLLYLLGTCQCEGGTIGSVRCLHVVEYLHAHGAHLGIIAQTVGDMEKESWADVLCEGVGVSEILRMIVVLVKNVGAVVLVGLAVLVCIGIVEPHADAVSGGAQTVRGLIVLIGEHDTLLHAIGTDVAFLDGVEVRVVFLGIVNGLRHFQHLHLHRGKAVYIPES